MSLNHRSRLEVEKLFSLRCYLFILPASFANLLTCRLAIMVASVHYKMSGQVHSPSPILIVGEFALQQVLRRIPETVRHDAAREWLGGMSNASAASWSR